MDPSDVPAATHRLLEALDLDRNGKVDALEIIEMIQHNPDAEELIQLLRTHPNPEKALNIQPTKPTLDRKGSTLSRAQQELDHYKQSLDTHTKRKKSSGNLLGSAAAASTGKANDAAAAASALDSKTSRLMRALDKDHDGHVDAHELIQMIREHSDEAAETLQLIKEHPDPAHALGCITAPRKYRRRSHLMETLKDAKAQLNATRRNVKRLSTLQTDEEKAKVLRRKLAAYHDNLKSGDVKEDDEDDENSDSEEDGGVVKNYDDDDDDDDDDGQKDTAPVSKIELTLRAHTRSVRTKVGCGHLGVEQKESGGSLASLVRTDNHVFLGVWKRTLSTPGAWPTCLCGSGAGGGKRARVAISSFDASNGVVWRFVLGEDGEHGGSSRGSSGGGGGRRNNSSQGNEVDQEKGFKAYLECTDHANESRLFLSNDLTLVDSMSEAVQWRVRSCPDGSFRHGPEDVAVTMSLAAGFDGAEERYLCVEAQSGEVALVDENYMDDYENGYHMYDNAWECTPDSEGPTKQADTMLSGGLDFPSFDSYM